MSELLYRYRCPHGHVVKKRIETEPGYNGIPAVSEYYCHTCRNQDRSPHYGKLDLIDTRGERSNVDQGYVWSPSHDEVES